MRIVARVSEIWKVATMWGKSKQRFVHIGISNHILTQHPALDETSFMRQWCCLWKSIQKEKVTIITELPFDIHEKPSTHTTRSHVLFIFQSWYLFIHNFAEISCRRSIEFNYSDRISVRQCCFHAFFYFWSNKFRFCSFHGKKEKNPWKFQVRIINLTKNLQLCILGMISFLSL